MVTLFSTVYNQPSVLQLQFQELNIGIMLLKQPAEDQLNFILSVR